MTGILWISLFFAFCMCLVYLSINQLSGPSPIRKSPPKRSNPKLTRALEYASKLYEDKRYLAAEKAYLEVIKLDHKNAAAYNRLGRIYLELKNFSDAIECCQIVTQIEPVASSFFNLGSALYENKNYSKALVSYERAIELEPSANRYMGLARTFQRLSNHQKAVAAYERAVELDDRPSYKQALLGAYRTTNNTDKAQALQQQLAQSHKQGA